MQPIDQPFRFGRGFCAVWGLLGFALFFLTRQQPFLGPWYSYVALLILASMLATFVLYGPVLFVHQIVRSGTRGREVARVFASVVCVAVSLFGGLLFSGFYSESRAEALAFVFSGASIVYLGLRLKH